jgi:O-antigen ligase
MSRHGRQDEVWDERLERAIEWLVLGAVAYGTLLFGGVRTTEMAVVTGVVGVALVLWLIRIWSGGGHRLILHPLLFPVVLFAGYAVWRAVGAEVPYAARHELWMVLLYSVTLVVAVNNLQSQDTLQRSTNFMVALGTLLSLYAVGQYISQSDGVLWQVRPAQYFRRAGATFVNPNHLATLMVLFLPMALGQVFLARAKGPIRVFHGYGAVMMLAGLAVTMSRGGWLAGGAVLGIFFTWLLIRRRQMRIPALVGLGLVLVAGSVFLARSGKAWQRITDVAAVGKPDSGDRLPLWKPAIRMWKDSPWIGVGPGHYDVRFPQYRDHQIQVNPGYAHNEYLNLLADFGLVGTGLVGLAILIAVGGIILSRKYVERGIGDLGDKGSNRTAFFVGASIGMVGIALHAAVDFIMHVPALGLTLVVVGGMLASTIRFASERWWHTPRWWSQVLITVVACGALYVLVPSSVRGLREGLHLNQAAAGARITPELLEHLKSAATLVPDNPRTAFEIGENLRRISFAGEVGWEASGREAIEWLEKAQKLNPRDPMVLVSQGLNWHWLGETTKASRAFEKAMDVGPNNVAVANHYAWNLLMQGRVQAARAIFDQSLMWNSWNNWFAQRYVEDIDRGRWKEAPAGN